MAEDGLAKVATGVVEGAVGAVRHVTEFVKALGFGGPAVLMCTVLMAIALRSDSTEVVQRVWPDLWWAWKLLVLIWLVGNVVIGVTGARWLATAAKAPQSVYEVSVKTPPAEVATAPGQVGVSTGTPPPAKS